MRDLVCRLATHLSVTFGQAFAVAVKGSEIRESTFEDDLDIIRQLPDTTQRIKSLVKLRPRRRFIFS